MKNNKFNYIRILIYIISVVLVVLVNMKIINIGCFFKDNFGIICPSCGITRATMNIIHLNLGKAIKNNSFYTIVLVPLLMFFVINDIYVFIKRIITRKKDISFIDIILN